MMKKDDFFELMEFYNIVPLPETRKLLKKLLKRSLLKIKKLKYIIYKTFLQVFHLNVRFRQEQIFRCSRVITD